jgi:hypothetical protein
MVVARSLVQGLQNGTENYFENLTTHSTNEDHKVTTPEKQHGGGGGGGGDP